MAYAFFKVGAVNGRFFFLIRGRNLRLGRPAAFSYLMAAGIGRSGAAAIPIIELCGYRKGSEL